MKSIVMFVVEHGDTTDPLTEFIDKSDLSIAFAGGERLDYELQVDVSDVEADFALDMTKNLMSHI